MTTQPRLQVYFYSPPPPHASSTSFLAVQGPPNQAVLKSQGCSGLPAGLGSPMIRGSQESMPHQGTKLRTFLPHWGPGRPATPAASAQTQPSLAPQAVGCLECEYSLFSYSALSGRPLQEEETTANPGKLTLWAISFYSAEASES